MITRTIHTRFWDDSFVIALDKNARLLFLYLLSCPQINISGVFEITPQMIKMHTGLTDKEISAAKEVLQTNGKVLFVKNWIKVVNVDRFNTYKNSPKNVKAADSELSRVPQDILDGFDTSINTSIDTPVDTNHYHNHNHNHNHKGESEGEFSLTWLKDFIKRRDNEEALSIGGRYTKNPIKVFDTAENVVLYVESKGAKYKNYKAVVQNWLNRDLQKQKAKAGGDWLRPEEF